MAEREGKPGIHSKAHDTRVAPTCCKEHVHVHMHKGPRQVMLGLLYEAVCGLESGGEFML